MTTDNTNNISSTDPELPHNNEPGYPDPYCTDDAWDEDDILPEVPVKRWVPDVRPDWWTDEMEAEEEAAWEADQNEEYLDSPPEEPEPAHYKRHPDASILQKFHQSRTGTRTLAPRKNPLF